MVMDVFQPMMTDQIHLEISQAKQRRERGREAKDREMRSPSAVTQKGSNKLKGGAKPLDFFCSAHPS